MKTLLAFILLIGIAVALMAASPQDKQASEPQKNSLADPQEKHLRNIRQLTFGGQNAEAYFSADGKWLIFQHSGDGVPCDQEYIMASDLGPDGQPPQPRLVSTGKGRTTCGFFYTKGDRILFSSTHAANPECPPPPDYSRGYMWPVYSTYEIYTARPDGSGLKRLTNNNAYDAEATIGPKDRIVFTSTRDGDLDVYTMDGDGKNVRRVTNELGYDGGPVFSPDGKKIVYRASHPTDPAEVADYKNLLKEGYIRPTNLQIWVMDADGSHKHQVTNLGGSNFAPAWTPDGKRIIFASNKDHPTGPDFDLYIINEDGSGLEQVTYAPGFDGFPMFSPDGKRLVWGSNRNGKKPHETNVFVADWVE